MSIFPQAAEFGGIFSVIVKEKPTYIFKKKICVNNVISLPSKFTKMEIMFPYYYATTDHYFEQIRTLLPEYECDRVYKK